MLKKMLISFSGGRTSAFMTDWLLNNKSDEYEFLVIFANTSQEHENTLIFVDKCDKRWGGIVVWVEAVVNPEKSKGTKHKIVTFETAKRKGEVFEQVMAKYGISNKEWPHCTRELKERPIHSYAKTLWAKGYETAIGIRIDETRRVGNAGEYNIVYPLVYMIATDKPDVMDFWSEQDFDLELEEREGNCTWCWKKSSYKHFKNMNSNRHIYDFPMRMEKLYGDVGENNHPGPRVFFREFQSTKLLLAIYDNYGANLNQHRFDFDLDDESGGCSQSCELYAME